MQTRREIVRKFLTAGVGASAVAGLGAGPAAARRNANPPGTEQNPPGTEQNSCPAGTRLLAKYEVSDCSLEFEKGEDVVDFTVPDEFCAEDELEGFEFEMLDGSDDDDFGETATALSVKYGTNVESFEPDWECDKQSGTVDLTDEQFAISDVVFCQGVYAQVDFVRGDVITDLCDDSYSERKIASISWGSYEGQLDGIQGGGAFDGDFVLDGETVTVKYDQEDYSEKVSLAVYQVFDPVFQDNRQIDFGATRCRQTLVDSDTDETPDGQLVADLPSP